jgi:hypothetical protein
MTPTNLAVHVLVGNVGLSPHASTSTEAMAEQMKAIGFRTVRPLFMIMAQIVHPCRERLQRLH